MRIIVRWCENMRKMARATKGKFSILEEWHNSQVGFKALLQDSRLRRGSMGRFGFPLRKVSAGGTLRLHLLFQTILSVRKTSLSLGGGERLQETMRDCSQHKGYKKELK